MPFSKDLGECLCERCGHWWKPKPINGKVIEPKSCAGCKSKLWNKPRKYRNSNPQSLLKITTRDKPTGRAAAKLKAENLSWSERRDIGIQSIFDQVWTYEKFKQKAEIELRSSGITWFVAMQYFTASFKTSTHPLAEDAFESAYKRFKFIIDHKGQVNIHGVFHLDKTHCIEKFLENKKNGVEIRVIQSCVTKEWFYDTSYFTNLGGGGGYPSIFDSSVSTKEIAIFLGALDGRKVLEKRGEVKSLKNFDKQLCEYFHKHLRLSDIPKIEIPDSIFSFCKDAKCNRCKEITAESAFSLFAVEITKWKKFLKENNRSSEQEYFWWRSRYSEWIQEKFKTFTERNKYDHLFMEIWAKYETHFTGSKYQLGLPKKAF